LKFFSFIFIIYIIVLTVQPCDDLAAPIQGSETSAVANIERPDEDCGTGETCSPFCFCSCCHVTAVFQYTVLGPDVPPTWIAEIRMPEYSNPDVRTYNTSFWQPPKA